MREELVAIKNMDHLGLVAGMIDELNIVECVDREIVSKSHNKSLSYGTLVKAMILNGLGYVNKRLYLSPRFFQDKPVEKLFSCSIAANQINDDSLGRTLDAIYDYGVSELYEKIAHRAMVSLGLVPKIIHLDSTSFHTDGIYNSQDEKSDGVVHITKGYSRDHHPELNQVILNLIVEHQAGIPLMMQAADGNQIDTQAFSSIVNTHIDSLKAATNSKLMLIADAALFTKKGLEAIKEKRIDFISRVPMRLKDAKRFISNNIGNNFTTINENYAYTKQTVTYGGITQQWILYRSTHAKSRENITLQKKILKDSIKETMVLKKLTRQPYYCEADANKALKDFKASCKTVEIVKAILLKQPKFKGRGRPKKDAIPTGYEYFWQIQTAMPVDALKKEIEAGSGLFILATNDLALSPEDLLDTYKSQQRVERGFRFLKSPEFLADSLFLKKPERIEAMLMIMTLCLMVYAALEYKIRQELKRQNKTFPNQLGKPLQNPTARWIFECFFAIHILSLPERETMVIGVNDRHKLILDLLGEHYWYFYKFENIGNFTAE